MSSSPFSLSVSPLRTTAVGKPIHVTITNSGSGVLHISTSVLTLHSIANGCSLSHKATVITIHPGKFTLRPGHHEVTTVKVPTNTPKGDYAAIYSAQLMGRGNGHVSGSVGSRITVSSTATCTRPVALTHHTGGINYLLIYIMVAAVIALAAGLTYTLRKTRRPRRNGRHNVRSINNHGS